MANILTVVGNPAMAEEGGNVLANALLTLNFLAHPPILRLYENDPVIGPGMIRSDFTECGWSGYAEASLGTMAAAQDEHGTPMITAGQEAFTGGSPLTIPGQAVGWYLVDEADTEVICAQRFADTFPINQVGDEVQLTPRVFFPGRAAPAP